MADSEMEIILAFLFKRSGKEAMSPSELYLPLSMDLQWFTPNQAKAFITSAIKQKRLIKKGDFVKPTFDYKKIVVPTGFHPSERAFEEEDIEEGAEEKEPDPLKKITDSIVKKTGSNEKNIIEKISMIADEKNISLDVAALLLSIEHNTNVEDYFDKIESKIFTENIE
ncbi:MAG: DUF2240 family protein [Thermoplasmatales archaeon]|nr:DUF2240 family protein [Thermoplasmatales archaeon]